MNRDLIQWNRAQYWDKPWNPIVGCVPVSPACAHCYANTIANRFGMGDFSKPHATSRTNPQKTGVVFCGNMTDLFGEWVSQEESVRFIGKCIPHLNPHLWLTKRVERMERAVGDEYFYVGEDLREYLGNHFFGFTAENQEMFDDRWHDWRVFRPGWENGWLSAEPLLGPISINLHMTEDRDLFKWVVVGCESGPKRRPCKMEWVEEIVHDCKVRNIPVFVKQLDIDGECVRDIEKFPPHLRIRQVPWKK